MAYIQDPALGFVPKTRVPFYQDVKVADALATKIFKFSPVLVTSGYAVLATISSGDVSGIAMQHMDADPDGDQDFAIISDSSVVFEVNGDIAATQADVGKFVELKTNGGTNDFSTATVDMTGAVAVATADTPFQIVGLSETVTDAPTTLKVRVKLAKPYFDGGFPVA